MVWVEIAMLLRLPIRGEGSCDPLKIEVLLGNEEFLSLKLHLTEFIYRMFVREVPVGLSDLSVKRLYVVCEIVQFARCLLQCVVSDDVLPGRYHLSAWLRLRRRDLHYDAAKQAILRSEFAEHEGRCERACDFNDVMAKVEESIVSLAMTMLSFDGMQDVINLSLSSFCPIMLSYGDERVVFREVRHVLEMMMEHGRIMMCEFDELMDGYVVMFRAYRSKFTGEPVSVWNVVGELYGLCENNAAGKRLLDLVLCLGSHCCLKAPRWDVDHPDVSTDFVSSVTQTVYSWMVTSHYRSFESFPDLLVDVVDAALVRDPSELATIEDTVWEEVGRVATANQRMELFNRLGYQSGGARVPSPEILRPRGSLV